MTHEHMSYSIIFTEITFYPESSSQRLSFIPTLGSMAGTTARSLL